MTAITIEGVSVNYGDTAVIQELDLTIGDGEFFTLLGPSGCGKTTLLRTIAGFILPARGRVLFGASDMTHVPTHKRGIGMVFQDYALFPNRTVYANVAYGLKARGTPASQVTPLIEEALERLDMVGFGDRFPAALSGGQRQRVALARALVIRPRVLLMDEPLSNLDTKLRIQIREVIGDLQREFGITTVFVTHDQEEALALSDRIALFQSGRIEQLGSPDEIYRSPVSSYAADFIGAANVIPVVVPATEALAGDVVRITLGDAEIDCLRMTELASGDAFVIARPEHLRLLGVADPAPSDGGKAVPGEVIRQQYLGYKRQHTVRLHSGDVIETAEPSDSAGFAAGERVSVWFPTSSTLVMAS